MAQLQGMRFQTMLYLGYASILAFMLMIASVVYLNVSKLVENDDWVNHTYVAIRTVEQCGTFLVDMETGVRGFLVTGKEEFLQPYQRGIKEFEKTWPIGKQHTSDNLSQTRRWDKLKMLKERWQTEVALPEISMRRDVNAADDALKFFNTVSKKPVGKKIFDELRRSLEKLSYKFNKVKSHEGAELILLLTIDLLNQETGQRGFLLTGLEESLEPFNSGITGFAKHFDALRKLDLKATGIRMDEIITIKTLVDKWHEKAIILEIDARREINKHPKRMEDVTSILESGLGKKLMDEMRQIVAKIVLEEEELLVTRSKQADKTANATIMFALIGTVFATVAGCFIGFIIVRIVTNKLGDDPANIEKLLAQISKGDLSMDIMSEKENAIGVKASSIAMIENLQGMVRQADEISKGNYDKQFKPRSNKDKLGLALTRMTEQLRTASAQNNLENHKKTGQAQLNEKLRIEQDTTSLTRIVITFLSEYFGAQVGAFYIATQDNMLELSASYAYRKRKDLSNRFSVGESLVGQAAREQKPILITEVPEDYIHITSGLGNTVPSTILIYPIILNNDLKGVIELGSVHNFSDHDFDFLDIVSDSIAIALNSADSRLSMKNLLYKTQQQAEDLKIQQEELRHSNESLEKQTSALKESEAELQAQQEELRQSNDALTEQSAELEEQTAQLETQKAEIKKQNIELRHTKEALEKKAKDLTVTDKYKSEFLANMSHELRTPLNSILLLSKHLADNRDSNLSEKQVECANTVYTSGNELLNLINDVLDLSKVESGKMVLEIEDTALRNITGAMERNFRPVAEERGVEFNISVSNGLPEFIRTDVQRFSQILKNLLSNAFKFTEKGSVTLEISRPAPDIPVSNIINGTNNTIAFMVKDTGVGIPEDKQDLVFQAFKQIDGSTSRDYGGTGLGLSISREYANLLGGALQLSSKDGEGSVFTLYLPETFEDKTPDSPADSPADSPVESNAPAESEKAELPSVTFPEKKEPEKKETDAYQEKEYIPDDRKTVTPETRSILIIEDDPKFAKVLRDVAREKGFKALVAESGETGLHMTDCFSPDGIILDMGLPGIDGQAVISRLKENFSTRHIPIHVISATDKTIEPMQMGAMGYLTKPVTMETLDHAFSRIEQVLSNKVKEVLVVEDNKVTQKMVTNLIGDDTVKVTVASTGYETKKLINEKDFDCMILDLGLPDMSGMELLAELRKQEDFHIPVVVHTARDLTSEERAMLDNFAESIVIKDTKSSEKLLDETTLFLHRVEADLPEEKRKMLRMIHDREAILENKKILVVDDDMRNVFALMNILEDKGIRTIVANNGKESLTKLKENPDTDLVLMDIMMPEMDGYTAMREIRNPKSEIRNHKVPIITLTAKAMKGDREKCIKAGASDYLSKPVDASKLFSMLRVWLY